MKQTALIFAAVILMAGAGFGIGFAHGGQPGADSASRNAAPATLGLTPTFLLITLLLLLELCPIRLIQSSFLMRGRRKFMRWLRR